MTATKRLYHEDSTLRMFEAVVLSARDAGEGRCDVVLDRTSFYPTGGGQPHDLGVLGGLRVVDVFEEGEAVVHRVEGALAEGPVQGEIDWERRLDHRQQHTGQHILSRAFVDLFDANTVGFHLGAERCTIDLDREDLGDEAMDRAERAANVVVMADLPVVAVWYPDAASVPSHVRKEAPAEGPVRILAVGTFDATPCCGTHCDRSGQVGPVKILRTERKKGGLRVEFVCGARALGDYSRRHRALRELALALTTEELDVPARVAALREEWKAARARAERAEAELRDRVLEALAGDPPEGPFARDLGPGRVEWLAPLASALAARRAEPVLLSSVDGAEARVAAAVPPDWPGHAGNLLREALAAGEGKGGGNHRLGQGRLPAGRLGALIASWESAMRKASSSGEGGKA